MNATAAATGRLLRKPKGRRTAAHQHRNGRTKTHLEADEEAGAELGPRGAGIEEGGGGVGEPALRQQVVRLDGGVDVVLVDANRHTHQHVLGALDDLAVDTQEVRPLQGLQQQQRKIVSMIQLPRKGRQTWPMPCEPAAEDHAAVLQQHLLCSATHCEQRQTILGSQGAAGMFASRKDRRCSRGMPAEHQHMHVLQILKPIRLQFAAGAYDGECN